MKMRMRNESFNWKTLVYMYKTGNAMKRCTITSSKLAVQ
jgi:hypothetical protein